MTVWLMRINEAYLPFRYKHLNCIHLFFETPVIRCFNIQTVQTYKNFIVLAKLNVNNLQIPTC